METSKIVYSSNIGKYDKFDSQQQEREIKESSTFFQGQEKEHENISGKKELEAGKSETEKIQIMNRAILRMKDQVEMNDKIKDVITRYCSDITKCNQELQEQKNLTDENAVKHAGELKTKIQLDFICLYRELDAQVKDNKKLEEIQTYIDVAYPMIFGDGVRTLSMVENSIKKTSVEENEEDNQIRTDAKMINGKWTKLKSPAKEGEYNLLEQKEKKEENNPKPPVYMPTNLEQTRLQFVQYAGLSNEKIRNLYISHLEKIFLKNDLNAYKEAIAECKKIYSDLEKNDNEVEKKSVSEEKAQELLVMEKNALFYMQSTLIAQVERLEGKEKKDTDEKKAGEIPQDLLNETNIFLQMFNIGAYGDNEVIKKLDCLKLKKPEAGMDEEAEEKISTAIVNALKLLMREEQNKDRPEVYQAIAQRLYEGLLGFAYQTNVKIGAKLDSILEHTEENKPLMDLAEKIKAYKEEYQLDNKKEEKEEEKKKEEKKEEEEEEKKEEKEKEEEKKEEEEKEEEKKEEENVNAEMEEEKKEEVGELNSQEFTSALYNFMKVDDLMNRFELHYIMTHNKELTLLYSKLENLLNIRNGNSFTMQDVSTSLANILGEMAVFVNTHAQKNRAITMHTEKMLRSIGSFLATYYPDVMTNMETAMGNFHPVAASKAENKRKDNYKALTTLYRNQEKLSEAKKKEYLQKSFEKKLPFTYKNGYQDFIQEKNTYNEKNDLEKEQFVLFYYNDITMKLIAGHHSEEINAKHKNAGALLKEIIEHEPFQDLSTAANTLIENQKVSPMELRALRISDLGKENVAMQKLLREGRGIEIKNLLPAKLDKCIQNNRTIFSRLVSMKLDRKLKDQELNLSAFEGYLKNLVKLKNTIRKEDEEEEKDTTEANLKAEIEKKREKERKNGQEQNEIGGQPNASTLAKKDIDQVNASTLLKAQQDKNQN